MARSFPDYLDQFGSDLGTCTQRLNAGKELTLAAIEEVLQQLPDETDAQFAGRCIGVFHAYIFTGRNFATFQKLGFAIGGQLKPELVYILYIFFGGTETPPNPDNVQLNLFIDAVHKRQKNQGSPD